MEALVREAEALLTLLAKELGADARASGASDAERRFLIAPVQRTREAAACRALPPQGARSIGLGRQVMDPWPFRPGFGGRLVGLEQWFSTLGAA